MPREIPRIGATDGHRKAVRSLIRSARVAALATTGGPESPAAGSPYASLVTMATDHQGQPLLLLSELADHTRNLTADPRCCLLIDEARDLPNPQTGPRVSLTCTARRLNSAALQRRFLARHPAAALYAGFGDFAIYQLQVERAHFVGGFGRAVWIDDGLTVPAAVAEAMAEAEIPVIEHMNADHSDAVTALAHGLLHQTGEGWKITALDVDGVTLLGADGETVEYLAFTPPLTGVDDIRGRLVALAGQARERAALAKDR